MKKKKKKEKEEKTDKYTQEFIYGNPVGDFTWEYSMLEIIKWMRQLGSETKTRQT